MLLAQTLNWHILNSSDSFNALSGCENRKQFSFISEIIEKLKKNNFLESLTIHFGAEVPVIELDRLSCSRFTSLPLHLFSHWSHNIQTKLVINQCLNSTLIRPWDFSVHLPNELFKKDILKSNPEVTKLFTFIFNDPKSMIDWNLALTLNLKVNFHHAKMIWTCMFKIE